MTRAELESSVAAVNARLDAARAARFPSHRCYALADGAEREADRLEQRAAIERRRAADLRDEGDEALRAELAASVPRRLVTAYAIERGERVDCLVLCRRCADEYPDAREVGGARPGECDGCEVAS